MVSKGDCITTDILSSLMPPRFSFPLSPPLFLPLLQMYPQQLVVSWFSLVLLASPIMAIWELEKNGNQPFLILYEGPRTVRQPLLGNQTEMGRPWVFLVKAITLG